MNDGASKVNLHFDHQSRRVVFFILPSQNLLKDVVDIICSKKRTVFRERSSRKTVSFEDQIMSKDKYPSILSKSNGGYCAYTRVVFRYSPVFAGEYSVT